MLCGATIVSDSHPTRWCIKLWDITSLGSVQVVGFFDVAARVCGRDRLWLNGKSG